MIVDQLQLLLVADQLQLPSLVVLVGGPDQLARGDRHDVHLLLLGWHVGGMAVFVVIFQSIFRGESLPTGQHWAQLSLLLRNSAHVVLQVAEA